MSTNWTDEEKCLLEIIRPVMSTREIESVFERLGSPRSVDAIQKQSRKLGISFKDFGEVNTHNMEALERKAVVAVLSMRADYLEVIGPPEIESPSTQGRKVAATRAALNEILADVKQERALIPRVGSASTKKAEGDKQSLVVLCSDWHLGNIQLDPDTREQTYNVTIGTERVATTCPKIIRSLSPGTLKEFDECVIILAGDLVTGEGIFPHQEMSLEESVARQVLHATKATWSMINAFKTYFPLVRVVTTFGNHGRSGLSPESNFDNLVYQQLELLVDMRGGEDITIKNRYLEYATVDVKGWKGMARHYAPPQADTAAGIAKFAGWHGIHEWDFFAFGHFHHWGVMTWNGKPIFRNGSLIGGDDYAEGLAKYDNPVQLCFGVSENSPCTFVLPVYY